MAGGETPYMGWTNPAHSFRRSQAKQLRDLKQLCQVYEQSGTLVMTLPDPVVTHPPDPTSGDYGEGTYALKFQFLFIEKPTFLSGVELGESQLPVPNKYPQITTTAGDWVTSTSGYATIWKGATLYVAMAASAGQKFYIHYTFTGKAMSSTAEEYTSGTSS